MATQDVMKTHSTMASVTVDATGEVIELPTATRDEIVGESVLETRGYEFLTFRWWKYHDCILTQ